MLKLKKLNFEIKSRSFVYTSTLVERQGNSPIPAIFIFAESRVDVNIYRI
jgi:hypothetical protein